MDTERIEGRAHRRSLGWVLGRLAGWELQYNKKSKDGTGKANILANPDAEVWGVLFDLCREEIEELAKYEGGYDRITLEVTVPSLNSSVEATTFLASALFPDLKPTSEYLQLILLGACQHGLPVQYCRFLASFKTTSE